MDPAAKNHVKTFPVNSVIIQEGQPHDQTIYILNEGRLGIYKQDQLVAEIREIGVFFGEMSALLGTPRTATVRALTECRVTVLAFDFDTLYAKFPAIAKKLMVSVARRLKDITEKYERALEDVRKMEEQISQNVYSVEHEMQSFLSELSHSEIDKAQGKAKGAGKP